MGKKLQIAEMWGNIGSAYRNMEVYEKAMEVYFEALPLYEKSGDSRRIDVTTQNLQTLLSAMGKRPQ